MSAIWLLLLALVGFVVAYQTYGKAIAGWLGVAEDRKTPAHELNDGVDYVPARPAVLLGHHFASIAGAAPIIGPATAIAFGWMPVYLWILVGGIFIGAVHDFASLMASIRHQGKSIGEVVEAYVGYAGKTLFLVFSYSTLILVVAVFTIVVAKTFVEVPQAATSSVLFMLLAIGFGMAIYRFKAPLSIATVVGVTLLFGCLVFGNYFPLSLSFNAWVAILLAYVFVASVTPVWVLLQPRDYLNSFLLYAMMALGLVGVIVANPTVKAPAFTSVHVEGLGYLFPVLFVTVACGAISGFHSLVSSGTTAKQLDREADARTVGYGAMLIESLLAVVALIAVGSLAGDRYQSFMVQGGAGPVAAFSVGLGELIAALGLPAKTMSNFVALAVSAFALTSLDTATRLSRFAFQEFFEPRRAAGEPERQSPLLARNRFVGTAISVALAAALAYSGSWKQIWPVFGSANQLLAALALLAVTAWLAHRARRNAFVKIPMVIMFAVTLTSLGTLAHDHLLGPNPSYVLGAVAVLLLGVALVLAGLSFKVLAGRKPAAEQGSGTAATH
ncbi:MAG: carbon starvation protein A [Myxococcales bacterium]|jgi:carbon starvation protein